MLKSCNHLNPGTLALAVAVGLAGGTATLHSAPASAFTVVCANCSTNVQQMMEYAEAIETTLNTAEQLRTQIQQYDNMVKQGLSLPDRMFGSVTNDLQRVANIYDDARSLGRNVANLDDQFREQFEGYESYLDSVGSGSNNMPDRYESWSAQGLDNARTAMAAAGMNTSAFENEDAMLNQMVTRSQTAQGRMQAIQAGNEIAAQNVQQLQKLRDLVANQITLQGNYMAQATERQGITDAAEQVFWNSEVTRGGAKGY